MKIKFPTNLTSWQKQLLNSVDSFRDTTKPILVISPRQCFKSSTIALLMIKASAQLVGDGVYIAPTLQQSRSQMQDITKLLSTAVSQANYQTLELTLINGSRIFFRSGQQKDSLRGLTAENFLIFDECCFLDPDFIQTALPLRRVKKALTIYISTPLTAEGFIWDLYNNPNTIVYDWSNSVSSIYTEEELIALKKQYSPFRYTTEILGKFAPAGQGLLFTNILDCIGDCTNEDGLIAGIDCSSAIGGDNTALVLLNRDYQVVAVYYNNTLEPVERVKWLADTISRYKVDKVVVEGNSMGDTYISLLKKQITIPIVKWVTTNISKRNIIEHLQVLFENKKITIVSDNELIRELQAFQANYGKTITYGGRNCKDDLVMALAIACYAQKTKLGKYNIS